MSEENKTAEEIKNVPETIYLLTSQHVENLNEDDELNFSDFSTEYVYWSEGESNDPYDTNYILKEKYDRQQEINADLQNKLTASLRLREFNYAKIKELKSKYDKQRYDYAELKKQNEELVELLKNANELIEIAESGNFGSNLWSVRRSEFTEKFSKKFPQ